VMHFNRQAQFVGQLLQLALPQAKAHAS
jgi:hypothetical protein